MVEQPSARLRLAAELAVGLARRLWIQPGAPAADAGFCYHYFQNPFEDAFAVLWELGVALADTGSGDQGMTRQQYPCSLKFLPATETRAGVLAYGDLPDALFGRLLAAYVGNACEYGPEGTQLCSSREPFKPAAEYEREIEALVACGYAERRAGAEGLGNTIQWTDKIAPVMRAEHFWDELGTEIMRPIEVSRAVRERVHILVQDRNPIAAMALVRESTGASLFEAKAYVDDFARDSYSMPPHRPRR